MEKVILASASPWRSILLKRAGIQFKVIISGHAEEINQKLSPSALVKKLAFEKAASVAARHKGAVVIGADTVAVFKGKILGKPKNPEEARKVLGALSGKKHSLVTGFAIIDTVQNRIVIKSDETKVWFRKLTKKEIASYVKTGEPLTVAGAYGIQGGGASFARKIEGDFYTIVGLPLSLVVEELRKLGVEFIATSSKKV